MLERLSDARARGHQVLAVVRGSAVNQDGASNGLTAPNGPAQQRVIRAALASARLSPADVDVVEGHGTGTTLGDPIEAQALLATYGSDRDADRPLWLGSVKSNIGHTQAAAGAAGVIKMVMAMRHGLMPPTLHAAVASPHVDWAAGAVSLLHEPRTWAAGSRPRRAGVSSFGISGTNAHVILEEAPAGPAQPAPPDEPAPAGHPVPWVTSARSAAGLAAQISRLRSWADGKPEGDVAWSLATTRAVLEHRAVLLGESEVRGVAGAGRLAVLFSGQGAQRLGMGRGLYDRYEVFRAAFDEVCTQLDTQLPRPLREVIWAGPEEASAAAVDETVYAQAGLFAIEVALFRLLESFGVEPEVLAGHSIGEVAAAHVAGVWSLTDAARLVAARGRLMQALPTGGGMVSVAAPVEKVRECLTGIDGVEIAGVNGPTAVSVSGPVPILGRVIQWCAERGYQARRLRVSHAFHSSLMDPMLADFQTVLRELAWNRPTRPIVCNTTGELVAPETIATPDYWLTQARQSVLFHDMVGTLDAQGVTTYLEVGPDTTLTTLVSQAVAVDSVTVRAVPCLRRDRSEASTLVEALAHLYVTGHAVDWRAYLERGNVVDLPTYAFQHDRYWLRANSGAAVDAAGLGVAPLTHPLLGAAMATADGGHVFGARLSLDSHPWLAGHVVWGATVLPGAAWVEAVLQAGAEVGCPYVEELTLQAPLVLPATGAVAVQVAVGADDGSGRRAVTIHSRPADRSADRAASSWTAHATGTLTAAPAPGTDDLTSWPPDRAGTDADDLYATLAAAGLPYGPAFRGLRRVWPAGDDVYAEVALPDGVDVSGYGIHPALLDAALHPIGLLALDDAGTTAHLPFAWTGVALVAEGATSLRVRATRTASGVSLLLADETGAPVARVGTLATRPVTPDQLPAAPDQFATTGADLYEPTWTPASLPESATAVEYETHRVVPGDEPVVDRTHRALADALAAVQGWLGRDDRPGHRLVVLTQGAVPAGDAPVTDLAAAAVCGLLRSAQAEHPDRFVLADVDEGADPDVVARAVAAGHTQFAVRGGRLFAPRLAPAPATPAERAPALDPQGTVLITGAGGALAGILARHLAAQGARRLLLTSRRDADTALLTDLAALGAQAHWHSADLADRDAVAALVAGVPAEHPLTAVYHTAGVISDAVVTAMTGDHLAATGGAKIDAAWYLHELTRDLPLTRFVLYSSVSATLGGPGQANYAAANAFLDALAQLRHRDGLAAQSLGWGLWAESSDLTGHLSEEQRQRIGRAGVSALPTEHALALLDRATATGRAHLVPARLGPGVLTPPRRRAATTGPAWRDRLATMPAEERERRVDELVKGRVADVLGYASAAVIGSQQTFTELGFDSLTAVELRNRLGAATDLRLPATLVFDHPTPGALAAYLLAELAPAGAPSVLDELARLEAVLAAGPTDRLAADPQTRSLVAARLRALTARWEAASGPAGEDAVQTIDEASDDELFDFIDRKYGRS